VSPISHLTAQMVNSAHAKWTSRFGPRLPVSASSDRRVSSVLATTPSPADPSAHSIVSNSDFTWLGDHENDRPRNRIASTAWSSSKLSPTRMSTVPARNASCQPTDDIAPA
jgi:hypothetical protein